MRPFARLNPAAALFALAGLTSCDADPGDSAPRKTSEDPSSALERGLAQRFEDVLPLLDTALERQNKHAHLPEHTYTWAEDQRSNLGEIEELLDEALNVLGTASASDARDRIRELETEIRERQAETETWTTERVSAPAQEGLDRIDKLNPFVTSRETLQEKIDANKAEVEQLRARIDNLKDQLTEELTALGLTVNREQVDVLLDTVTADDQIALSVVFFNVRQIAEQLEAITEQSGEELASAHRYYGMYIVLLQVLDLAQNRLVEAIEADYVPRLVEFSQKAEENVRTALDLIDRSAGDVEVLEQNILSNRTTQDVTQLYIAHLNDHARALRSENEALASLINTAQNTYETVKLSTSVARLIRDSSRDLRSISELKLPPLRGFQNESMRKELRRLSDALTIQ